MTTRLLMITFCALSSLCGLISPVEAQEASADSADFWVSPGVKLSWTFGEGVTYGVEISLIWSPASWEEMKEQPFATGLVLNADTNFNGLSRLRLGGEFVGPFIGVEGGPSLIWASGETHLGLGLTFWAGYGVYPHYTWTGIFGDHKNLHELGVYLKAPINTDGEYNGDGDSDWDWD